MNIYTIRDNLVNTIKGKEAKLQEMRAEHATNTDPGERIAAFACINFLEINIKELTLILEDVEVVAKQSTAASWRGDDRQMGI